MFRQPDEIDYKSFEIGSTSNLHTRIAADRKSTSREQGTVLLFRGRKVGQLIRGQMKSSTVAILHEGGMICGRQMV